MSLPEINDYKDNENVESAIVTVWNALTTAIKPQYLQERCRTLLKFVVDFAVVNLSSSATGSSQLPLFEIAMFHHGCLRIKLGERRKLLIVTDDVMEQIKSQLINYCKFLISKDNLSIPYHVAVKCCDLLYLNYKVNLFKHFNNTEMGFLHNLYQRWELKGDYNTCKRFFSRCY
ncbi:hypothetical protein GEMRC1_001652 [Eukaryota sp. GEM-RC1]